MVADVKVPPNLTSLPVSVKPFDAVVLSDLSNCDDAILLIRPVPAFTVTKLSVNAPDVKPVTFKAVPPVAIVSVLALLVIVVAAVRLPPNLTSLPVKVKPFDAVVLSTLLKRPEETRNNSPVVGSATTKLSFKSPLARPLMRKVFAPEFVIVVADVKVPPS